MPLRGRRGGCLGSLPRLSRGRGGALSPQRGEAGGVALKAGGYRGGRYWFIVVRIRRIQ